MGEIDCDHYPECIDYETGCMICNAKAENAALRKALGEACVAWTKFDKNWDRGVVANPFDLGDAVTELSAAISQAKKLLEGE